MQFPADQPATDHDDLHTIELRRTLDQASVEQHMCQVPATFAAWQSVECTEEKGDADSEW